MTKTCALCGETKPLSEFHRRKSAPDGYRGTCKACRDRHETDRSQRHEPGHESLIAAILDAAVDDFQRPYKFKYVKHDKGTRKRYGRETAERKLQEHTTPIEPDGEQWADYKVTKRECVEWVCGPVCQWYLSMVLQDIPIQEKQRGLLRRMGIEGDVPDYCVVCDKECDEYDSDDVCIHHLCKVDRDAMQAESMEVR